MDATLLRPALTCDHRTGKGVSTHGVGSYRGEKGEREEVAEGRVACLAVAGRTQRKVMRLGGRGVVIEHSKSKPQAGLFTEAIKQGQQLTARPPHACRLNAHPQTRFLAR